MFGGARWGRTRSGASPWPAAVTIGLGISGSIAAIAALLNPGPRSWLLSVFIVALTLPVSAAFGWVLLVDRRTVPGAIARPEESVESSWYSRATQGAFHDVVALIGLLIIGFSIVPAWRAASAPDVLLALVLFLAADMFIRYRVLARRG